MIINGKELEAHEESAIYIPKNTLHSAQVIGKDTLHAVQFYVGSGPEQRFTAGKPL